MRFQLSSLAFGLSATGLAVAVSFGAVGGARAADVSLFYAPGATPEAPPVAPLIAAGNVRLPVKRVEAPRGRVCFNPAETRDKITTHRLTEPFRALRTGRLQGEALRARLCRWNPDVFVYEVSVLRRDGRVIHVYMNAQNGQNVGVFGAQEHK